MGHDLMQALAENWRGGWIPFQLLLSRYPTPYHHHHHHYHPQVPPNGASALAPGGSRSLGYQGLETSDPRACLPSWAGQTCLGASHILPGLMHLLRCYVPRAIVGMGGAG